VESRDQFLSTDHVCSLTKMSIPVRYNCMDRQNVGLGQIHPTQHLRFGGSLADIVHSINLPTYLLIYYYILTFVVNNWQ